MPSAKQKANWARFAKMAKSGVWTKKGKGSGTTTKKGSSKHAKKTAVAPFIGAAIGGYRALTRTSATTGNTLATHIKHSLDKGVDGAYNRKAVVAAGKEALTSPDVYVPVGLGVAIEVARDVPLAKELPKLADRVARKMMPGTAKHYKV